MLFRSEGFRGNAVRQTYRLGLLEVCDNLVEAMGEGALVMGEAAGAERLVCRANQFSRLGEKRMGGKVGKMGFAALQLLAVRQAELRSNSFNDIGAEARDLDYIEGVRALAVDDLQVVENHFTGIGPPGGWAKCVCIQIGRAHV